MDDRSVHLHLTLSANATSRDLENLKTEYIDSWNEAKEVLNMLQELGVGSYSINGSSIDPIVSLFAID